MNRLALSLGITSVIFASTTVYFARELRRERASYAPGSGDSITAAGPTADVNTYASETTAKAEEGAVAASLPPVKASENEMEPAHRKARSTINAELHATLHDPEKRAEELRNIRKNYERNFSGLPLALDLTQDEYNRLLDILVEQELRGRDATSGCVPSAGCDIQSIAASQRQLNRQQLAEFMGSEKAQRYRDYIDNFIEREAVANFRGRLPDSLRLSDIQAEKLTAVLGDERRRMRTEWEQRGTRIAGIQGEYGQIFYPATAQGVEQRTAEASEFLRRQHERAAEVLTAAQLEAFTQRQQEMLDDARNAWESGVP